MPPTGYFNLEVSFQLIQFNMKLLILIAVIVQLSLANHTTLNAVQPKSGKIYAIFGLMATKVNDVLKLKILKDGKTDKEVLKEYVKPLETNNATQVVALKYAIEELLLYEFFKTDAEYDDTEYDYTKQEFDIAEYEYIDGNEMLEDDTKKKVDTNKKDNTGEKGDSEYDYIIQEIDSAEYIDLDNNETVEDDYTEKKVDTDEKNNTEEKGDAEYAYMIQEIDSAEYIDLDNNETVEADDTEKINNTEEKGDTEYGYMMQEIDSAEYIDLDNNETEGSDDTDKKNNTDEKGDAEFAYMIQEIDSAEYIDLDSNEMLEADDTEKKVDTVEKGNTQIEDIWDIDYETEFDYTEYDNDALLKLKEQIPAFIKNIIQGATDEEKLKYGKLYMYDEVILKTLDEKEELDDNLSFMVDFEQNLTVMWYFEAKLLLKK